LCENADLRRRPWYYMHPYADPQDPHTVWVLNLDCWRSVDGGKTFESIPTPHGDNHGLWIDPRNSDRMIEGNDGGAANTPDGGRWAEVVQPAEPANCAVLSRHHRQPRALWRVRLAAGQLGNARAEHQLRGRDFVARLHRTGRRRERLHRHRPEAAAHGLWRR